MIKKLMYKGKSVLEWSEILGVDISRVYNKKSELGKGLGFAIKWLINYKSKKKNIIKKKKNLNLMFCPKCRGGVYYSIKNKKAYCRKCGSFLGIVCKVKDLEIFTN